MKRYWIHSLVILIALAIFVPIVSARPFFVGAYGPGFYGPGYGWYGPAYGWYGPGWGYYTTPPSTVGKVKFDTKRKDAMVYVDGGYAGTVGGLKTFALRAGNHDIELRGPDGQSFYQERVDVIGGKTTKLIP